ncbi:hypothetical protein FQA39_LY16246 [Lamprigera yunnana]|nr:hypothetical protein FQA39_LY16246 [Lamprigera yunnana]
MSLRVLAPPPPPHHHHHQHHLYVLVRKGLSEATVHVTTALGSVNLEYYLWRAIGNVNGKYGGIAPNVSGLRKC